MTPAALPSPRPPHAILAVAVLVLGHAAISAPPVSPPVPEGEIGAVEEPIRVSFRLADEVRVDGTVLLRFHGACVGCPSSTMTLRGGIERQLRDRIPEVSGVETV